MSFLLMLNAFTLSLSKSIYTCQEGGCYSGWQGDGICDRGCMNSNCNYDSSNTYGSSVTDRFISSDCFSRCMDAGCEISLLNNDVCNNQCNIYECGWDLGDCGFCKSGCTEEMLTNDECDSICNESDCKYDNNACGWCAPNCFKEDLEDYYCKEECNNYSCNLDNGVCTASYCAVGCSSDMLINDYCNYECNNKNCNYDNGKCECSLGCNIDIMSEQTCRQNEPDPCATYNCQFKNGLCGDCAAGCFTNMLGNGVCNDACNNFNCSFDYQDCSCAPGCGTIYNQTDKSYRGIENDCTLACLVSECNYNIDFCHDLTLIRGAILNQIINSNMSVVLDLSKCGCTSSELAAYDASDSMCDKDSYCNNQYCLYCYGRGSMVNGRECLRSGNNTCLVSDKMMVMYESVDLSSCPIGYQLVDKMANLFTNSSKNNWCLSDPTKYSPQNYKLMYVMSTSEPTEVMRGIGTEYDPINSLYYALYSVYAPFTKIILLSQENYFSEITIAPKIFVKDLSDPLNTQSKTQFIELWLIGNNPVERNIVYWKGKLKFSPLAQKVFIQNIEFVGTKILRQCTLNHCLYCPLVTVGKAIVDDRMSIISNNTYFDEYGNTCSEYKDLKYFYFTTEAHLENVTFTGFRTQSNSLIYSSAILNLSNVDFIKNQPYEYGAIIDFTCDQDCSDAHFYYINGSVKYHGAGYEATSGAATGVFIKGNNIYSMFISGVKFSYNFAYSGSDKSSVAALIYTENIQGPLEISGCIFDYNFGNYLIFVDASTLVYDDLKVESGTSTAYSQTHFKLANCVFSNNYMKSSILSYPMSTVLHNIQLDNVTIINSTVGSENLISIEYDSTLLDEDTIGKQTTINFNGVKTTFYIPPRWQNITNLTILNARNGATLLNFQGMSTLTINNLTIGNVYDGNDNDVNSIITQFNKSGEYLSTEVRDDEKPTLKCSGIIKIIESYKFNLNLAEIFNTSCEANEESSGISIMSLISEANLKHVYFYNISSLSNLAICLDIKETSNLTISDMTLSNVTNALDSIISIYDSKNVNITTLKINKITSVYSSPFVVKENIRVNIMDFLINQSMSIYGNGGCLEIIAPSDGVQAYLSNGVLLGCSSTNGVGGIYFDSISDVALNTLNLDSVTISNSNSQDGSMIYISKKIALSKNTISIFKNIFGTENVSSQGGSIADYHNTGLLQLKLVTLYSNSGLYSSVNAFYPVSGNLLEISDSMVSFSYSSESDLYLRSLNSDCLVSINNLTVSSQQSTSIQVSKLTIKGSMLNIFNVSQAVILDAYSKVFISKSNFTQLSSISITATKYSYFECSFCIFAYNKNTILSLATNSYLNLSNCELSNNTADITTLISVSSNTSIWNYVTNCTIQKNTARTNGQFYLMNAKMKLSFTTFSQNSCTNSDYAGIFLVSSTIEVVGSTFLMQTANAAAGFFSISSANITIADSLFSQGTSQGEAGAIYLSDSSLSISNSIFRNNTAKTAGGCISSYSSSIIITACLFFGSVSDKGSSIYAKSSNISISSSEFQYSGMISSGLTSSSVYAAEGSFLSVYYTIFEHTLSESAAIVAIDYQDVKVDRSEFKSLTIKGKGALTVDATTVFGLVTVNNSIFSYNNSTGNGAGININNANFLLQNTEIAFNKATTSGGGVYLSLSLCSVCMFNITGNTSIHNNYALKGGAINWLDFKPNINNSVSLYNNSADYGNELGSDPAVLYFDPTSRRLLRNASITAAPGQVYTDSIYINLFDTYGHVLTTDNTSKLMISGTSLKASSISYSLSGTTTFTSTQGVFQVTGFTPIGSPGTDLLILLQTDAITTKNTRNDETLYNNSMEFVMSLRNCSYGEQIGENTCIVCPTTKYLIEPDSSCKSCPTGGTCPGGSAIIPSAGYWRSDNYSEVLYPCEISGACLGGNETDFLGQCSSGYAGILCQSCESGYSRSSNGKCSKCPDQVSNIFILIALVFGIVFVAVILVKTTLKSAFSQKSLHSIYIKIFTNYLQLVFLTTQFNLEWPTYVISLFDVQKSAATVSDQVFSVDCYMVQGESNNVSDAYFYKLVLLAVMPFMIFVVSLFVWIGVSFLKNTFRYLKRELLTTLIVLFFLVYPNIVKSMFSNFSCKDIDKRGSYLSDNTAIECWDAKHTRYSLIVALPGIIVWAVGVPFILLSIMTKLRKKFHLDINRVIFGFLFNGYKSQTFYWEFVIMYRKIIMITISVFMNKLSTLVQALTVVIVLLFCLYLQYSSRPYNSKELNHMEIEGLFTATLTIYCGLYYLSNGVSEYIKMLLFVVIVFGNAYFLLYWVYYMLQAILDMLIKAIPSLKATLKRGDAFEENFYSEELKKEGTYLNKAEGTKHYTFFSNIKEEDKDFEDNKLDANNIFDLYETVLKNEAALYN